MVWFHQHGQHELPSAGNFFLLPEQFLEYTIDYILTYLSLRDDKAKTAANILLFDKT